MFARRVYTRLKPDSVVEFTQRLETEIIPLLRKQNGFQDENTFMGPGGKEAFALSLWTRAEDVEAYNRRPLCRHGEDHVRRDRGSPLVETCDVANFTFHKTASMQLA